MYNVNCIRSIQRFCSLNNLSPREPLYMRNVCTPDILRVLSRTLRGVEYTYIRRGHVNTTNKILVLRPRISIVVYYRGR